MLFLLLFIVSCSYRTHEYSHRRHIFKALDTIQVTNGQKIIFECIKDPRYCNRRDTFLLYNNGYKYKQ